MAPLFFAAIIFFAFSAMECQFAAIYFPVSLVASLDLMAVLNFCGNLVSQQYLPRKYRENKSLTKLTRASLYETLCPQHMLSTNNSPEMIPNLQKAIILGKNDGICFKS